MALGKQGNGGILQQVNDLPGVRGSALVTRDGLPHDFQIPGAINHEVFAAMGATMLGAAETAYFELGAGESKRIRVESDKGGLLLAGVSEDLLLMVVCTDPDRLDGIEEQVDRIIVTNRGRS